MNHGAVQRILKIEVAMRSFNFVVERDPDTGLFVGHVPGWPGAHSQGRASTNSSATFRKS